MRHVLTMLSLMLVAGSVGAEESYSAKSLFFGEDESVVAVSTSQKDNATAVAVSTPPKDNAATVAVSTLPTDNAAAVAVSTPPTDNAAAVAVSAPPTDNAAAVANASAPVRKTTSVAQKKKPAAPSHIGASYFIRLKNPDGTTQDVLASRKFKSGERFQLGVKVNAPSYIYILNEDPNGKVAQIYPQPGHNNFVNAMGVVYLPSQGAFEFDNVPGTEQLIVYVSPKPMPGAMPELVKSMRPDIVSVLHDAPAPNCSDAALDAQSINGNDLKYASKAIHFSDESQCSSSGGKPAVETYASKGIAFSDDATPANGGQVASYVVKAKTTPDASLFLKLKLAHQ